MPPFGMGMVVGQLGCAGDMQPLQPPLDTQAALIEMDDRGGEELLLDARPTDLGAGNQLTVVGDDDRLRGRLSVEIGQQLGRARQRYQLIVVQIAGLRFQTRTILSRLAHAGRKCSLHAPATARTLLDLCLMLCHFDANRRYVEHLPFHLTHGSHRLQLCLALRATRQRMEDDMVRFLHLRQSLTFVTRLPPARSLARLTQTLAAALLQTVAARRLAAVATIFRQLILQFLDQHLLPSQLLLQGLN